MDIATLVGIIIGLGAIVGSIFLMTPDFGMFGSASSFGIVFGGMIASVAVAFPLKDVLQLGAAMGAVFKGGGDSLGELVEEAVEASEAGRKGTADLEKHIDNIEIKMITIQDFIHKCYINAAIFAWKYSYLFINNKNHIIK